MILIQRVAQIFYTRSTGEIESLNIQPSRYLENGSPVDV